MKSTLVMAVVIVCLATPAAFAETNVGPPGLAPYTGSLSTTNGGLTDGTGWNGWVAWDVTQVVGGTYDQWWQYKYSLVTWLDPGASGGQGISHVIIEASLNAEADDFLYWAQPFTPTGTPPPTAAPATNWTVPSWSALDTTALLGTWAPPPPGNSNPGMPGSFWGIKVDTAGGLTGTNWAILSTREPTWGDFYVRDGTAGTHYLYNTGFVADDDNVNHLIVPDTIENIEPRTPELPATALLLASISMIGLALRRRRLL